MPVNIEYKTFNNYRPDETVTESLDDWLHYLIRQQRGIEREIDVLMNLARLMVPKFLEQHPELVSEVAQIMGCPGVAHRIVEVKDGK